jgi:hypothetical protein
MDMLQENSCTFSLVVLQYTLSLGRLVSMFAYGNY